MPICGYFLSSLLSDPAFKQYHAKFGKPKDSDISYSMYNCPSYYATAKTDTLDTDSTEVTTEVTENSETPVENINHTNLSSGSNNNKDNHKDNKKEKKELRPVKEEEVKLEDL